MTRPTPKYRPFLARLALCLAALLFEVTAGFAHASLNASDPVDGAVLPAAPPFYFLTFSEPVAPLSLRLVTPDGSAVALDRFTVLDRKVEIQAPAGLARGTHVLSWRVVSADGHPIGGSVVFSIGEPSAAVPDVQEDGDNAVRGGLWLSRIAIYIGLFFGVGGVFAMRVLMPGLTAGRRALDAALALGALGALSSVGLQGLDALGAPLSRLTDPLVWSTALGTSYGSTVLLSILAFALAAAAQRLEGGTDRAVAVAALIAVGAALASSGHASAAQPQWLMRPAVFLHAVAVAAWIGALLPLGLALRPGGSVAVVALRRFSTAIPVFVAALIVAGVVLTIVQVERPGALLDTAYGQVFFVKLLLLVGLFAMAAVNRWSLTGPVEEGDGAATRRLVRSIAAETLVALTIFAAVATWRFTPPPRALATAAAEPVSIHIHSARAMADLTITPGRAGPVAVSAVIMTGDFGPLAPREVSFAFSNPTAGIESFKRKAAAPGDGTWRADGIVLPLAGAWHVRIDILVTDFEMVRLEGEVRIRP